MAKIIETDENNIVHGFLYENNYISGRDGDDLIYGGYRNDWIDGGTGNDTIYGNDGNDTILGQDGNDFITGDKGHDCLYGGDGDDTVCGGDGDDCVNGGAGNDHLDGNNGNDQLLGREGDDYLDGGRGNDAYLGYSETGFGADTINEPTALQYNDKLFLTGFAIDDLTWEALDTDLNGYIDALKIIVTESLSDSVTILNYFDGHHETVAESARGLGSIQGIYTQDGCLDFKDVQNLFNNHV